MGGREKERGGRHKYHLPRGQSLALLLHFTCYNHFFGISESCLSQADRSHVWTLIAELSSCFVSFAWLDIFSLMLRNKSNIFQG